MIKEPKGVDFFTTGRQPSEAEFSRISELIRKEKAKLSTATIKRRVNRKDTESTSAPAQIKGY